MNLRRVAANVFVCDLLSRSEVRDFVEATEDPDLDFDLDRSDNLPAEDVPCSATARLLQLSNQAQPAIESAIKIAAKSTDFKLQIPYIVRYTPHGRSALGLHADRSFWSCVIHLQADCVGGALDFPTLGLTFPPRAGRAVIFPGTDLYPHRSLPVTQGKKIALVAMTDRT